MTKELAPQPEASALTALLSDPARLKDFPVENLERLFAVDKEIREERARIAFNHSFNAVQAKLSPVVKKAQNTHTRSLYARAEDIMLMLDPILIENGFSRSLSTEDSKLDDHVKFVLILRHISGHVERHCLDAPVDDKGLAGKTNKTKMQGLASSYTFCERQLLVKVCGVTLTEDDDGNAAGGVGHSAECVTESQALDLDTMIDDVSADRPRFFKFFKINELSELPASRYKEAITMLQGKVGKKG